MKKGLFKLGEILVEKGLLTPNQLYEALEIQKKTHKRLGEILIEKGLIKEEDLVKVLACQFNLEYVDLDKCKVSKEALQVFSPDIVKQHRIFPLKIEGETLVLVVSNPLDIFTLQNLKYLSGYRIKPVLSTPKQIDEYINKYFGPMREAQQAIKEIITRRDESQIQEEVPFKELEKVVQEAPIIRLVNSIIAEAIVQEASDIHLEPQKENMRIRYRIDGVLYERMNVPKHLQPLVISRIKIISGMDIAERRRPQDGRMSISMGEREYDIRVSTLPDVFGEKVVLRILDKQKILIPLENLGLDKEELAIIERLIYQPYGMILVTGPTGSGKTTTLYSILHRLNDISRNIVTIEDPVEYELPGINQTSVNVRAGYTFATGLRHILRQDPDVIMVGEIRDLETAEISIQAALTGHLVLSTLHTNSASGAIARLLDMDVEPFLISSSVIGVIAQRLVRKLCPLCKEEYRPPPEIIKEIKDLLPQNKNVKFARPKGCEECKNLGYKGRTAIFEILRITPQIKRLILKRAPEADIEKVGISEGMKTLRKSGVIKALNKITSLEEVMRVAFVKKI